CQRRRRRARRRSTKVCDAIASLFEPRLSTPFANPPIRVGLADRFLFERDMTRAHLLFDPSNDDRSHGFVGVRSSRGSRSRSSSSFSWKPFSLPSLASSPPSSVSPSGGSWPENGPI